MGVRWRCTVKEGQLQLLLDGRTSTRRYRCGRHLQGDSGIQMQNAKTQSGDETHLGNKGLKARRERHDV